MRIILCLIVAATVISGCSGTAPRKPLVEDGIGKSEIVVAEKTHNKDFRRRTAYYF
ncbi:MAG: hypothetical protein ACYTFY_18555 [Planctomycetota bacterium]|jgi:hypothetical protein